MNPPKIVLIRWVDSTEKLGWDHVENMEEPDMVCVSVGFVMRETKSSITIVHSITGVGTEDYAGTGQMTIPKSAITDLTRIG